MKFPTEKELEKNRKKLEKTEGSLVLSPNASPIEKLRYEICRHFVVYKREHDLSCKDLAKLIGVDESLMSKILRYRHDRFSTDKLIDMFAKIYPKHHLALKVS
jgi:predicted XRE-type DNA-binding protein